MPTAPTAGFPCGRGKRSTVTLRARHPGRATIHGANLAGRHLALTRLKVTSDINVLPGSSKITVTFNRISGGYFGVERGPDHLDEHLRHDHRHNKFVGPFGEDAIRLNRYHDGRDRDPYGILIEANEITSVRENGSHSDCLQSVWGGDDLYFRRNYLHDNRCQGFFIKDQPRAVSNIVFKQNLMLRNAAPCDPPGLDCGEPAIWQVFGPTAGIRLSHNTIWTTRNKSPLTLREGPFGRPVDDRQRDLPRLERLAGRLSPLHREGQHHLPSRGDLPGQPGVNQEDLQAGIRRTHARTITVSGTAGSASAGAPPSNTTGHELRRAGAPESAHGSRRPTEHASTGG